MTLSESSSAKPKSSDAKAPDLESDLQFLDKSLPTIAETNSSSRQTLQGFWPVFFSTFLTIFLAELGDKTQVTTLLMSAESQSPLSVFLGAGTALVATSLIGVLLGKWLSNRVSEETLDTCAGVLLMLITIGLVADIVGI